MSERRKCMRFNANIDVRYEVPQSVLEGISITKDISANGMQLPAALRIDDGTRLGLKIMLPEEKNPVFATAEVIWSRESKSEDENMHDLGLCFVKIDSLDRSRILDYIYKNWLYNAKVPLS